MKTRSAFSKGLAVAALGAALAVPHFAFANGEEFFQPAGDGKVDLVYFGKVKDQDGKVLDNVNITVVVRALNMAVPISNDTPGHYRTPDIGAMLKEAGQKVDPAQLQILCMKDGYKQVKPAARLVPNKATGTIEVDFVLAKE